MNVQLEFSESKNLIQQDLKRVGLALLVELSIGSLHLFGNPGAAIVLTGLAAGVNNSIKGLINGHLIIIATQRFT